MHPDRSAAIGQSRASPVAWVEPAASSVAAERRMSQRGLTLLELLVVLAMVALALTLVPGLVVRGKRGLDLDLAARAVGDALRAARSDAMVLNRDQLLALDGGRRLSRGGGQSAAVAVGSEIEITFQAARTGASRERTGQIRFFPDGTATGGRFRLTGDGRHVDVVVDWLTGLVAVGHATRW